MEPLAKLFGSPARLKILRLFIFNQQAPFTSAEVVSRTKLGATTVRGELADLAAVGVLHKRGAGRNARYRVNPHFEHFAPLNVFIRETTSIRPKDMLKSLKRAGALRLVALSGFFTSVVEPSIDLLVVGDGLDDRSLAAVVRVLEAEFGREIRYAALATPDFRYRLGVYDRLIRDVFDYPHRLLIDKIGL